MIPPILVAALVVVAGLALAALVWPLARRARAVPSAAQFDRAVYRDQLAEVERDLERGVLAPTEAASARLEIERRLLATASVEHRALLSGRRPMLAAVLAVLALAWAVGLYLTLGAPREPAQPFADRTADKGDGHQNLEDAAAQLEAKLKAGIGGADGWMLLARTEGALDHWDKAAEAYQQAIAVLPPPPKPDLEAAYGETLVLAARGIVTPAAHEAFNLAIAANPGNQVARFYLATAAQQSGDNKTAIDLWLKLAGELSADSDMRAEIGRRVASAAKIANMAAPALPSPASTPAAAPQTGTGPTDEQMQAAQSMSPAQRDTMIRGMVAKLEGDLNANPNDVEGWLRLARSYLVLGEPAKSESAYDRAAKLSPNDTSIPLGEIEALLDGKDDSEPLSPRVLTLLERVKAVAPDQPEGLWLAGLAAMQQHHADDARGYWTKLLRLLPQNSESRASVEAALKALGN